MNQRLSYAPPSKRKRRWSLIFIGLMLIALLFSFGPIVSLYDWLHSRRTLQRMQADCMALAVPADTLVYVENADVTGVWNKDVPPLANHETHSGDNGQSFITIGRGLGSLQGLCYRAGKGPLDDAMLFCHARTTASSRTLLVAVMLEMDKSHFSRAHAPMKATAITIEPAGWLKPEIPRLGSQFVPLGVWPAPGTRTRFYAGQPDPSNLSRFTIAYTIGDQPGVIDGVLNNDLTVTLTLRTGPLAKPTTRGLP